MTQIAFVAYPGVTALDVVGPYEVLRNLPHAQVRFVWLPFQAVKHACADMMIEIDATRATVMFAAMSAANGDELQTVAPLAKAQTAETFVLCAGSALQIHGAIAFTWEHDLHLYYRRAKTTEALFGSSARNRALLAERAGLVKA